jgi:hypothetical protein
VVMVSSWAADGHWFGAAIAASGGRQRECLKPKRKEEAQRVLVASVEPRHVTRLD